VSKENRASILSLLPKPKEHKNRTTKNMEIEAEFFGENESDISESGNYTTDSDEDI